MRVLESKRKTCDAPALPIIISLFFSVKLVFRYPSARRMPTNTYMMARHEGR